MSCIWALRVIVRGAVESFRLRTGTKISLEVLTVCPMPAPGVIRRTAISGSLIIVGWRLDDCVLEGGNEIGSSIRARFLGGGQD
jgi:hypothetical protein